MSGTDRCDRHPHPISPGTSASNPLLSEHVRIDRVFGHHEIPTAKREIVAQITNRYRELAVMIAAHVGEHEQRGALAALETSMLHVIAGIARSS